MSGGKLNAYAVSGDIPRFSRHGKSKTPIYYIWSSMIRRCYEINNAAYHNYGGRGILVCDRWHSFMNFYDDMGDRPTGRSLDRMNNSLGYSKENCAWATRAEQARNRRNNRMVTIDGQTKTLTDWCKIYENSFCRVSKRIRSGWDEIIAIKTPLQMKGFIKPGADAINAKLTDDLVREIRTKISLKVATRDIAEEYGVTMSTIYSIGKRKTWAHVKDSGAQSEA